ncbi:MAG: hypothetical protein PVJ02_06050 [Gemmatimonadota bacterium]
MAEKAASVLQFGRIAPMSQAMALALVEDPSSFKAVVDVGGVWVAKSASGDHFALLGRLNRTAVRGIATQCTVGSKGAASPVRSATP